MVSFSPLGHSPCLHVLWQHELRPLLPSPSPGALAHVSWKKKEIKEDEPIHLSKRKGGKDRNQPLALLAHPAHLQLEVFFLHGIVHFVDAGNENNTK